MNVLLDTHAFLWYFQDSEQLSAEAAAILEDTSNTLFLSIASLWEVAIKLGLGKLELQKPFHECKRFCVSLPLRFFPLPLLTQNVILVCRFTTEIPLTEC
jgi:PIN domain nuclease of toxin-antitoxin system